MKKILTCVNVTSSNESTAIYAAEELTKYLQMKGVAIREDGFAILVAVNPALEEDGYKIEATENGLTIEGDNTGVLYGVYNFLEKYAGIRFFTPTLEVCPKGDIEITDGVLMEYAPAMKARRLTWYCIQSSPEWCVKQGINFGVAIPKELGGQRLNYGKLFVHTINALRETTYPYPPYGTNPCMTDPEILETVIKNVRKSLAETPNANIISVSQNDFEGHCECPNCKKIEEEDGSPAGPFLRFVNKIAEDLEKDYPNLTIDTLAYKYTQKTPKVTKPRHNVCIRLCSINCCFTHPIDHDTCPKSKTFHDDIVGWGKICNKLHIWDYTTNFHYYISTFPNFGVIHKNMRFFAENNVVSMFPQGNGQGASGEFGELRAYLLAKLMWNPSMNAEEYYGHMDEFLAAYYDEGWTYIRQYIDMFSQYANISANGMGIYSYPFTVMHKDTFASMEEKIIGWWDAAEMAAGDRLEYVKRSRWQVRYMSLFANPNKVEAEILVSVVEANKTRWSERFPTLLWYVYEYDLLAQAPDKWFTDPSA